MTAEWGQFHCCVRLLTRTDGSQSQLQVPAVLVCIPGVALPVAFVLLESFVGPQSAFARVGERQVRDMSEQKEIKSSILRLLSSHWAAACPPVPRVLPAWG